MRRAMDRRLAAIEDARGPHDALDVTVIHTAAEPEENWAAVMTVSGQPTPHAVAARARLQAEGYVVREGYARP